MPSGGTVPLRARAAAGEIFNARGARVGTFERDARGLWLVKRGLSAAEHQLRKPPAWATDAAHLHALEGDGGCGVRIVERSGRTWEATLAAFRRYGIAFDRGHGPQVALALLHWRTFAPGDSARQLPLLPEAA